MRADLRAGVAPMPPSWDMANVGDPRILVVCVDMEIAVL
jgi:hypothetical protein